MHPALFVFLELQISENKPISFTEEKLGDHREENRKNCPPQTLTLSEPVIEVSRQ